MDKRKIAKQLKDKRYTYHEIGTLLGISRQRVHQILTGYKSPSEIKPDTKIPNDWKPNDYHNTKGSGNLKGREFSREIVRKRDNHTCQICGKKWKRGDIRLDVHHIDCDRGKTRKYDKVSEMGNMITLCHKCHLNLPEHKNKMKKDDKK